MTAKQEGGSTPAGMADAKPAAWRWEGRNRRTHYWEPRLTSYKPECSGPDDDYCRNVEPLFRAFACVDAYTPRTPAGEGSGVGGEEWRTGFDIPAVEHRHRTAAAWALDLAPDSATWENLTAYFRTPDQVWRAKRVAEAFARFERDTLARAALARSDASKGGGK